MSTAPTVRSDTMPQAIPVNEGRRRVVMEGVQPTVDGGRFPVKRSSATSVVVEADAFADGHDAIAVVARATGHDERGRVARDRRWSRSATTAGAAASAGRELGRYRYTVAGWVDRFGSWRRDFVKRVDAGPGRDGRRADRRAASWTAAAARGRGGDRTRRGAQDLGGPRSTRRTRRRRRAGRASWPRSCARHPDRSPRDRRTARSSPLVVDRVRARFSAWYELFPRSTVAGPGTPRHVRRRRSPGCDYVAELGFDVALPAARSTRSAARSARARTTRRAPGPATPAARGRSARAEGGHTAVHPELGTLDDFDAPGRRGARAAASRSRSTSPSSARPTTRGSREHPEWFRHRPDGTIQYAENPPKKYQDIYPFDFESRRLARAVGRRCATSFRFWIEQGVQHLPRRQPAHQAVPVLGVVHRRGQARPPGGALPGRGVHPARR